MEDNSGVSKIGINVRALIFEYENKAIYTATTTPRARTRSLGNILTRNVVVKYNDFKTLDDLQSVLEILEQRLQQYKIYNKEEHVTLQDELFNISTSLFNVDHNDPNKAKNLLTKTKNILSALNEKLPSNVSVNKQARNLKGINTDGIDRRKVFNTNKPVEIDPVQTDEPDSLKTLPSVKILKEKFQSIQSETEATKTKVTGFKSSISLSITKDHKQTDKPKTDEVKAKPDTHPDVTVDNNVSVSVSQLRSIFEKQSEENAHGLPLILKEDKSPLTRFNFKSNLLRDTHPEDLERIQVSSYIPKEEHSGLLPILKNELHYELNINDVNENTVETTNYAENNENDSTADLECIDDGRVDKEIDSDDEESSSSSGDTIKSGETVVMVMADDVDISNEMDIGNME